MNLTQTAIEKSRITIVVLIVIVFAGYNTYRHMPRAEDPGFIIRTAVVSTFFPGASPERVEQLITDKLEKAIQEMPEIDNIVSESKTGISYIYVNIQERYRDMRPIWDSLRRKVERAQRELPDGIIGPFVDDEFGDVFGTIVTLTGEGYSYAELKEVADDVRDELLLIEETAKVEIHGAQEERVFVEYTNARLAELGLSASQLIQILQAQNIVTPGGDVTSGNEMIVLEPTGSFESVDEIRRTVVSLPGKTELLYLRDIANVYRGYVDPPTFKVRSSGVPALALAVNLREGGNIIALGERVVETVRRLQTIYPIGIEFDIVAFQPDHVDKKVKDFVGNLLQAIGIVIVVMLVALGFRTGIVVASLIPMAMIMAILFMGIFKIGLDQMSLASLIIALGMLVDNAIVMSESIMVQMASGKRPIRAAVDSANELRVPLLVSSLTTAAAFLPIYLAESAVGEYCAPLFKVVTITLLCSWILALTMTPLFCVRFLKAPKEPKEPTYDSSFYRRYRQILISLLRRPVLSIGGIIVVFMTAMVGMRFVPNIFFPSNDKAIITAELRFPIGTPIEVTDTAIASIEDFIDAEFAVGEDREEGILNWSSYVGGGAPRFFLSSNPEPPSPDYGILIINGTSLEKLTEEVIPGMEGYCLEQFPEAIAKINLLQLGPPVDSPIAFRILGKEEDGLFNLVEQLKAKLSETPGTKNITDDWGRRTKKLMIHIDQARAQRAGVTNNDIAVSLQTSLTGIETTQFREGTDVIPVTLRSVAADRDDIGKVETINVFAQMTGQSVPLRQVADIEVVWQPSKILRRDRLRSVTVKADVVPGIVPIPLSDQIEAWLREESTMWDVGYRYEVGGEKETSGSSNESIMVKLPIAGFIIILLLVMQFNSFRRPLIILLTIPLGMIGVTVGLLVAKSYFGFMTLLGVVSLAGIVINNAIVLIDRIRIERENNRLEPARAVVVAAQRRMRPILLTTTTTVGGLLPLWFGGGPMYEPMAIAIIFGLLFATILTLVVVPILYSVFFRVKFKDFKY